MFRRVPPSLRAWVLPAALLALWWIGAHGFADRSSLLVTPEKVFQTAVTQFQHGLVLHALAASLTRDLAGFSLGCTVGLLFGVLLGSSRLVERLVGPSFHVFKQISLFAWIPLISMWFGLGDTSKIIFLSLAAFFPVVLNTYEGIRSVPEHLVEVAHVLRFTRLQRWTKVLLPSAAPSIFTGVHLGLIYAWLATLGAEYLLVAGNGIGNTMIEGRENFQIDLVLFGVIVVGVVGSLLNWMAGRLEAWALAWRDSSVAPFSRGT